MSLTGHAVLYFLLILGRARKVTFQMDVWLVSNFCLWITDQSEAVFQFWMNLCFVWHSFGACDWLCTTQFLVNADWLI